MDIDDKSSKYHEYIGTVINDTYVLEKFLGEGAMGIVFLAKEISLDRFVAVKIIKKEALGDTKDDLENVTKRFKEEARNIAKLSKHQNVVSIYSVGTFDRMSYIVMEYVEGVKLSEYMVSKIPINWVKCLKLIYYISQGLEFCHNSHVIHRDIKPANVMIELKTGTIKLVDYGLSKYIGMKSVESITHKGTLIGTPRYLAPELWESSKNVSEKCDVYSLGILVYELLTGGKYPYKIYSGENEFISFMRIYSNKSVKPVSIKESYPEFDNEYVENLVSLMLKKDPSKRCNIKTVIESIRHIFEKYEITKHLYTPIDMKNFNKMPCLNSRESDKIRDVNNLVNSDINIATMEIESISDTQDRIEEQDNLEKYSKTRREYIEQKIFWDFVSKSVKIYLLTGAILFIVFLYFYFN